MTTLRWLLSAPFRLAGYLFVVLAFLAGMFDIWQSVSQNGSGMTPLGQLWFNLSPETLNLAQAAIQRGLHPSIWDPGVQFLLGLPAWLSLFLCAAVVLLVAQLIYRPR